MYRLWIRLFHDREFLFGFLEACGKPNSRGIIPDYEVEQKPEDTAKGIDTVLQFTLDLISNGGTVPDN